MRVEDSLKDKKRPCTMKIQGLFEYILGLKNFAQIRKILFALR